MKRFVLLTLGLLALTFVSLKADDVSEADAEQLTGNCGEIRNRNASWQYGDYLWLEYIVETARPQNSFDCPWLSVSVEASVVGIGGSGASKTDLYTATVRRQVPVPEPGTWQTNGRHYRNYAFIFSFLNGETASHASVTIRADEGYGGRCFEDPNTPCQAASSNGGDSASPIILDVARDGYGLTSLEDGVFFDLDADGSPELVSWTRDGSDDAFLALDRNGNGTIDDGSELFGNNTPLYPAGTKITAANGFDALRFLEGPAYGRATRDEIIDARDAAYGRLLLWTDRNHDGISQPGELQPLAGAGLKAISTDYRLSSRKDRFGNEFRQRAKATWTDGETYVFDVWLLRRP